MRYSRLRRSLALIIPALLALSLLGQPLRAQGQGCQPSQNDPNSNVSPTQGTTVTRFFFCARGFGREETLKLWVHAPDGGLISEQNDPSNPYSSTTTRDGEGFWSWFPPQGWGLPTGTYTMVARGTDSGVERVILFEITGVVQAPEPTIRDVQPEMALAGTVFRFWARGYDGAETLNYIVRALGAKDVPDPENRKDYSGSTTSGEDGRAVWTWKSRRSLEDGVYEMVIEGERSKRSSTITFSVGKPPLADPKESGVSPKVGTPGTRMQFFARGFSTEEQVRRYLVFPDGSHRNHDEEIPLDSGSPTERVRADWEWTVPPDAPVGVYVMVAEGKESGVTHHITFEVTR